jgi:hypothetical protein
MTMIEDGLAEFLRQTAERLRQASCQRCEPGMRCEGFCKEGTVAEKSPLDVIDDYLCDTDEREDEDGTVWDATDAFAALKAIRAMLEPQPIATAPKDGRRILGCASDEWFVCRRHDAGGVARTPRHNYECWVGEGAVYIVHPTHWLPLPSTEPLR